MDGGPELSVSPMCPKLAEVLRLSAALTDQILDAQIMGRAVPADRIDALVQAATLLQDHGVVWPAPMQQVLHEFTERPAMAGPTPEPTTVEPLDEGPIAGLSRFLGAVRRERAGA